MKLTDVTIQRGKYPLFYVVLIALSSALWAQTTYLPIGAVVETISGCIVSKVIDAIS